MNKRSFLLHPLFLVASIWLFSAGLYQLRLSRLLGSPDDTLYTTLALILLPCVLSALLVALLPRRRDAQVRRADTAGRAGADALNWALLKTVMKFWAVATAGEIVYSGGLPLVWLIIGSEKGYADFGLPSLHGVMNAILLVASIISFRLWLSDRQAKYLLVPAGSVLWGLIVISRHLVLVNILQMCFLYFIVKDIKVSWSLILKTLCYMLLAVVLFGYVGDLRSGRETLFEAAQIDFDYPEAMPSGFLWIYLYLTTPLNNLFNTVDNYTNFSYSAYYTLSQLVPSFLRSLIYSADELVKGELVSETFNVSTAYVDAFKDYGLVGIALYSQIISLFATLSWRSARSPGNDAICAVLAQCALISIFYNHYFVLPILIQIPFVYGYYQLLSARTRTMNKEKR